MFVRGEYVILSYQVISLLTLSSINFLVHKEKKALYRSVDVFCTKVLIGDPNLMGPPF